MSRYERCEVYVHVSNQGHSSCALGLHWEGFVRDGSQNVRILRLYAVIVKDQFRTIFLTGSRRETYGTRIGARLP